MTILEDFDLKPVTTFHVTASARYYCKVTSITQLLEVLHDERFRDLPRLILGGGSNILFTKDFPGLVIHPELLGKKMLSETDQEQIWQVGAGENWDEFVQFCIQNNLAGVENLAYIPGSVGSAPVQNIGAYGVEIKDSLISVDGYRLDTLEPRTILTENCQLGYRNSIFKRDLKNNFVITTIKLKLQKPPYQLKLDYGNLKAELAKLNKSDDQLTIADVYQTVAYIRKTKLPDPAVLGSAGSFFKNPLVEVITYEKLKSSYPDIPSFPGDSPETIKIPAAWLIDKMGWKGKRFGDAGVHENHALILVNYGNASGQEIWDLAEKIKASVAEQFGIQLESEVNIY